MNLLVVQHSKSYHTKYKRRNTKAQANYIYAAKSGTYRLVGNNLVFTDI